MANSSRAKSALPYARRLLEDEYVQEQLREAVSGLRNVYGRAARERAQAADDKKLYANLRRAVTSIRNATTALRPEPAPKRQGRKLLIIGLAAGGAAMLARFGRARSQVSPPAPMPPTSSPNTTRTPASPAGQLS
jgi:hypothetical protein